jgi:hypothetical protein
MMVCVVFNGSFSFSRQAVSHESKKKMERLHDENPRLRTSSSIAIDPAGSVVAQNGLASNVPVFQVIQKGRVSAP